MEGRPILIPTVPSGARGFVFLAPGARHASSPSTAARTAPWAPPPRTRPSPRPATRSSWPVRAQLSREGRCLSQERAGRGGRGAGRHASAAAAAPRGRGRGGGATRACRGARDRGLGGRSRECKAQRFGIDDSGKVRSRMLDPTGETRKRCACACAFLCLLWDLRHARPPTQFFSQIANPKRESWYETTQVGSIGGAATHLCCFVPGLPPVFFIAPVCTLCARRGTDGRLTAPSPRGRRRIAGAARGRTRSGCERTIVWRPRVSGALSSCRS